MDIVDIERMYDQGYTIDFIARQYYNFRNSKVQQNYFNTQGNLVVTKKFKKQEVYDYVYKVIYDYYMKSVKKAD